MRTASSIQRVPRKQVAKKEKQVADKELSGNSRTSTGTKHQNNTITCHNDANARHSENDRADSTVSSDVHADICIYGQLHQEELI